MWRRFSHLHAEGSPSATNQLEVRTAREAEERRRGSSNIPPSSLRTHQPNATLTPATPSSGTPRTPTEHQRGLISEDEDLQKLPKFVARTSSTTTVEEDSIGEKRKAKPYQQYFECEATFLLMKQWYHGLMPREEIVTMLQNDGDFLVRRTEVGKKERIAISYKWGGQARHMLIKLNEQNRWVLRSEAGFESVEKLIQFYMTTKSEIKADGSKLLNPISRPDWYILHEHVALSKKLGSGSFGEVFLAELTQDDKKIQVAVKTLKGTMGKQERATFVKEASINRRLVHPNIVRLLGIASQLEPVMVVLELAPGGSLQSHVKKNNHPPATLTKYLLDAAKGLEYLSEVGIIHRDVAARNCLLDASLTVKISDFGLSIARDAKEVKHLRFPVKWLSPETLRTGSFSFKTDVWSYGVMMWEVYSRCRLDPYPGQNNAQAKQSIMSGNLMATPEITPTIPADVMRSCWLPNPDDRPSFAEIVKRLETAN